MEKVQKNIPTIDITSRFLSRSKFKAFCSDYKIGLVPTLFLMWLSTGCFFYRSSPVEEKEVFKKVGATNRFYQISPNCYQEIENLIRVEMHLIVSDDDLYVVAKDDGAYELKLNTRELEITIFEPITEVLINRFDSLHNALMLQSDCVSEYRETK
jgi:hypothetical protein